MNGQTFLATLSRIVGVENAKTYALRFGSLDGEFHEGVLNYEALAVYAYSTELAWHAVVNRELWSGSPSREVLEFAEVLNLTLAKLPPYLMNDRTVFRGFHTDDLPALLARHRPGSTVYYPAFTSASFKRELAFGGNVLFIIRTLTGRAIWYLAANYDELEVLIPSGRSFLVVDVDQTRDRAAIVMDELP